jgi:hypothetical protein
MKLIPKPKEGTRTVFAKPNVLDIAPYISGIGKSNYVCGGCGHLLLKNIDFGQIDNIVFPCPKCGKYNQC